ncbi:Hint domain-containing protein [Myxococcus sp. MxC21-1]|uniref:Hint domain-containing protein n=1 Tax=Myxococcus sp. MxC21-1 TaxID=3041439 RepID=UPI0029302160|nr:Hint domain-containing protein [Myxococcus sp. MxC21-1]WNZ64076.1 Hint domain-containing protein [Myxococcus sp. MxC21-1]
MKKTIFAVISSLTMSSSAFAAWAPNEYRCTFDQLTADQAEGRQRWAKRWQQQNPYNITTWGGLDHNYWHSSYTLEANQAVALGYWLYPVYVDPDNMYTPWKGPGAYGTATASYTGSQIQTSVPYTFKPANIQMDGVCEPGCYTPDQKILLSDGAMGIREALESGRMDLVTLSPEASFSAVELLDNKVEHYTLDRDATKQEILTFRTRSGGELRVTTEHPLVTPDGTLKRARELGVGDSLVDRHGQADEIVSLDTKWEYTRAYNVRPVTTDLTSNIIIAQGYLNGSQRFQSEYVDEMNRMILRSNVPEVLVPAGE